MPEVPRLIRFTRLKDQVREAIRQRIIDGALRPGDQLVERDLTQELGVSLGSIREALIELENWGYVQRIPRRETRVTRLTREDVTKISQVRIPLENVALELALQRGEKERLDLSELEQAYSQTMLSIQRKDWQNASEWDRRFHRAFWRLADNDFLFDALDRIFVRLCTYYDVLFAHHPKVSRGDIFQKADMENHYAIIEAVKTRSLEMGRRALNRQFHSRTMRNMLRALQVEGENGQPPDSGISRKTATPGVKHSPRR